MCTLAAASCMASASCTLMTDLSGYSGEPLASMDGAPDSDVSLDGEDGTTLHASDTGGDASDTGEGGPDAAPGACASRSPKPVFCTDFDDGRSVVDLFGPQTGRWTLGQPQLDALARSGKLSMLLHPVNMLSSCGYQDVSKDVVGSTNLLLEYSIRLGDAAGAYTSDGSIASISYRNGSGGCNLVLSASPTGAKFTAQEFRPPEVSEQFPLAVWPQPGVWTTMRITVTADATSGSSRLVTTVGGKAALDQVLPFCKLGTATVRVGTYCEPYRDREVRIDDLVIDAN